MEFKGTKGKWNFKELDEMLSIFEKGKDVDQHSICGIWSTTNESKANAQLISKAPEMLEMLIKITNQIDNEHISDWLLELQDNAIQLIEEATKID